MRISPTYGLDMMLSPPDAVVQYAETLYHFCGKFNRSHVLPDSSRRTATHFSDRATARDNATLAQVFCAAAGNPMMRSTTQRPLRRHAQPQPRGPSDGRSTD